MNQATMTAKWIMARTFIEVTALVSHAEMLPLKSLAPSNKDAMSVTRAVFHVEISPNVSVALV